MPTEFDHPKLAGLTAANRAKVENALKATLERQLTTIGGANGVDGPVAAHSRSQGAFFSRSKTTDQFRPHDELDATLLQQVTNLDDAKFAKFADRLAQVKNSVKAPK